MVIMHYDTVCVEAGDVKPPELIRRFMRYKGIDDSFRQYQNNLVFLVADKDQVENMVDQNRRYLAIHRILSDPDRMASFNEEQIKKIREMSEAAELEARIAITRAYRYLFYPTSDVPKAHDFLRHEALPPQDQGEVEQDQTNVVLRVLKNLKKVQTADDEMLSAQYVRSKVWGAKQTHMSTEDLRREFARHTGIRMLLDIGQLKKTIRHGVESGVWLYYDARGEFAYDKDSPPPVYEISEDTLIYSTEEAKQLGLKIKGKWVPEGAKPQIRTCPVCGNPQDRCTCGVKRDDEETPAKLQAEGEPTKAFTNIADQCQDHKLSELNEIYVSIDGVGGAIGNDLRTLALIVPQLGKATFALELELLTTFGEPPDEEVFEVRFNGSWDRYKRARPLIDDFTKEAKDLKLEARLSILLDPPISVGEDRYTSFQEIFSDLEIDRIRIEAVPARKKESE